jgi:hypothetical protein
MRIQCDKTVMQHRAHTEPKIAIGSRKGGKLNQISRTGTNMEVLQCTEGPRKCCDMGQFGV